MPRGETATRQPSRASPVGRFSTVWNHRPLVVAVLRKNATASVHSPWRLCTNQSDLIQIDNSRLFTISHQVQALDMFEIDGWKVTAPSQLAQIDPHVMTAGQVALPKIEPWQFGWQAFSVTNRD